jgi:hypothetical protein
VFLTERAISLLIYALALLFTCFLMKRVVRNQYKIILFLYLILLCIFAFNYKPYITADIFRLREYITYWTSKSWNDMIIYAFGSSHPAWVIYSWILNKFGNENWLQTITCLWCFGNIFYIIGSEIGINEVENQDKALELFYIMAIGAFYLQTISGIRSMLAVSIVAFCAYQEIIKHKNILWHILLYLFAALVHPMGMILVLSRILFLVFQEYDRGRRIILTLIAILMMGLMIYYLRNYIADSFDYGSGYLNNRQQYSYIWEIIIGLIEIVETLYVDISYKRVNSSSETANALMRFSILWCVGSLIALPFSYSIFRRFSIFATVLSIPLIYRTLYSLDIDDSKYLNMRKTIIIVSSLIFIISLLRGDLCGYKLFVLSENGMMH